MEFSLLAQLSACHKPKLYEHRLPTIQVCHIICSRKAVELPGRVTIIIQYNVHVFSTEDVVYSASLP